MQFKKKNPGGHNNPPPSPVDCIKLPLNLKGKKWSTNAQIHLQVTNSDNHAEYKQGTSTRLNYKNKAHCLQTTYTTWPNAYMDR